jgi:hypothetical protein
MALPNKTNIRNFSGEGFFRLTGDPFMITLGHSESISTNTEVERDDVLSGISGVPSVIDVDVTSKKVSGTAVLRETGARQIGMAVLAKSESLLQDAASAVIISGAGARTGYTIDLGYLNISDLTVTDGTDPLVDGVDYTLDAAAGLLTFLTDQSTYDATFDAAAIAAENDQSLIAALSAPEGIEGELTVVQRQRKGRRYKWRALVRIFPDGELVLSREGTDKATVSIAFEVIEDMTKPEGKRHGILEELAD